MENNFYRGLIFPPIVLGMLAGLFHVFEVFDVLLIRDEKPEHIVIATRVPSPTPTRAVGSSSAIPQPFSPTPMADPLPTLGEFAVKPTQTNWPPQIPVKVAVTPANLPSATPNAIGSEDPENIAPPDEPEASAPPGEGYKAPVNAAGGLLAGPEMSRSEVEKPLVQGTAAVPVIEEPIVEEQEPPQ